MRAARKKRIVVFAEGSHHTDPKRRRDSFDVLWKLLLAKCGLLDEDLVRIIGFSKDQLVALRPPPKFRGCQSLPLDLEIKRVYDDAAFDVLVIAFDLIPKHNALQERCRKEEIEQLLVGLCDRSHLPQPLLAAATALLEHYRRLWMMKQQNLGKGSKKAQTPLLILPPGRPRPPQALELLVMDPMFESLPLADEQGFRTAIGLKTRPKGWPRFDAKGIKKPDQQILLPAFKLASKNVRILVDKDDKHQIAEFILRRLPHNSVAWEHCMMARLRRLVG